MIDPKPPEDVIRDAIEKAGGAVAIATAKGIRRTSVYKWIYKRSIPPRHIEWIAKRSGISSNILRPDVFNNQQKTPSGN